MAGTIANYRSRPTPSALKTVDRQPACSTTRILSVTMRESDGFDAGQQPRCARCGTVLRDRAGGYECSHCQVVVLRTATGPNTAEA